MSLAPMKSIHNPSPPTKLRGDELLLDWYGRQVRVKGLIAGYPELLMVGKLVGVSEIGLVVAWKNRRHFFPWANVSSLSLDEEVPA